MPQPISLYVLDKGEYEDACQMRLDVFLFVAVCFVGRGRRCQLALFTIEKETQTKKKKAKLSALI